VIREASESGYAAMFGMPKPRKVTAPETSLKPQLRPNQGAKVQGGGVKRSLRPRLRPTTKPDNGLQSSLRPRLRPDDMPVPASAGGVARSLLPRLRPDSVGTEALVSELEIALGVEKPAPVDTAIDNNIVPVVVPDQDGEITVSRLGPPPVGPEVTSLAEELGAAIENAGMSSEMNDALKQISGSMNDKLAELDVDMDSAMFFDNTRDYIAARDSGELVEGDEIVIGTDGNLSTFLYTEGRDDPKNAVPTMEPVSEEAFLDDTNMTTVSAFKKAERASRAAATQADTEDRISTVQSVLERNRQVLDKSNYTFGTITDTAEEDFEVTISTSGEVYDSEGTLMDAYIEDGTVFNRAGAVIGSFVGEALDVAADYALDTVESVTKAVQSFGTSEFVNFLGNAARPGGKLTSADFNEGGLDAMREAIRIARADGRSYIKYEDLGTTNETILKEPLLKGLFDPETRIARGLGVFNFKMNDAGETVITDTYDFNEGSKRTTFYEALKSGREVDAIKALSSATLTEQASMIGFARQEELKAAGKKWQTDISINLGNMGDRIAANLGGVSKSKRPQIRK